MEYESEKEKTKYRCITGIIIVAISLSSVPVIAKTLTNGYWSGVLKQRCADVLMITPDERLEPIKELCL